MLINKKFNKYFSNNIRWLVNGALSDPLKKMLDSVDTEEKCEVIRNRYFKKILKYVNNQETFYIKRYIVRNRLESVKSLFSSSKASREWDQSHRLLNKHLLTAEPVAVGEKRRFGMLKDCYIISKEIPNCLSGRKLLANIQQPSTDYGLSKKNTLLRNIISYVNTMHNYGIFHGELHADNILIDTGNLTLFYLLDLGCAKHRRNLPLSWRIKDISRLLYSLKGICTDAEITELIGCYEAFVFPLHIDSSKNLPSSRFSQGNQPLIYKNKEVFSKAVFSKIYRIKRKLWYGRARRCFRDNNVFKVASHDHYTINMRNEWDIKTLIGLINEHILSLKEGQDNILKVSSKIGITSVPLSSESTKRVCIKEYKYLSFSKQLLYSFHNSPARRAWFAAHGLMALNFQVPEPIALCEEKRFGILKKSFIIMEDASALLPCNTYVIEKFGDPHDEVIYRRKQRFVSCLAESFRQLHDSGVYHGDLKANNIIVMESNDTWNFFYLDLDRVWFKKWLTLRKKIKNLSQLNASLPHCITYTDRLRFYRTYAGVKNLNDENKRIVRAIVRLSIQRKHVWTPRIQIA